MQINKHQFAVNSFWKILEQFSAKSISMLVSIVLARILLPSDYGLIALTTVFTTLSDILIDAGFSTALIQKESVDDYDYSAVFSVNFSIAVALYALLFFTAPYISEYYSSPQLTSVLRVIGITFFLQSFMSVRNGIINRNMQFKLLFLCNIMASITSGVIGIATAYAGWGVWALVTQRLLHQVVVTVMLFIKVKWRLCWKFDWRRIKQMFSFSLGVVGSSLLNYLGGNIYSIVIGKKYSVTDLGYYDKGNRLPLQFSLYTFGAMSSVLLPTVASSQSDLEKVKHIIRRVICMASFLIIPMMIWMALVSKEIILLLFTDKWLPSLKLMQCACLYYIATPYMLINVQVFFALGYSRLRVKTEIIRLIMLALGLAFFSFVHNCSINVLACVCTIIAFLMVIITYFEVKKLINYKIQEVFIDIWKSVVASIAMGFMIYVIEKKYPISNCLISVFVKTFIGVVVYCMFAILLKIPELNDIINLLHRRD